MSFIGLEHGRWQLYIVSPKAAEPQVANTALESRTPAYHPYTGKVTYIGADGSVREIALDNVTERVLLQPDERRTFTQPAYDAVGNRLFVVALKDRASADTDIAVLDGGELQPVVTQQSAQFEPYFYAPHLLYYSNVLCAVGCGKVIQEIWRMHLVSGEAEQLTLLNAIARQPVVSRDGEWLYFSSNKAGHFHIWRLALPAGRYEQLTTGLVTDISPALDREGNLYFIRHSPIGAQLIRRRTDGELRPMPLPDTTQDLRDLRIHP